MFLFLPFRGFLFFFSPSFDPFSFCDPHSSRLLFSVKCHLFLSILVPFYDQISSISSPPPHALSVFFVLLFLPCALWKRPIITALCTPDMFFPLALRGAQWEDPGGIGGGKNTLVQERQRHRVLPQDTKTCSSGRFLNNYQPLPLQRERDRREWVCTTKPVEDWANVDDVFVLKLFEMCGKSYLLPRMT